jgi:hypothetical protein
VKRFRWLFAASGMLAVTSAAALAASGASATAASTLPTITVALNGKTVVVGGTLTSGAVNVVTTVTHEQQGGTFLFRLNPGESPSVFPQAVKEVNAHQGDLNYLESFGSIVFDSVNPPGTSSAQANLSAGTYLALDVGGDANVPPHSFFTVAPSAAPAALPKAKATLASIEFGFTGPTTLHDGELVQFVNNGFLVHMDVWNRVKNMADAKVVAKALLANKITKKVGKLLIGQGGFAGPMSRGGLLQTVINEKPGIYVQECFMATENGVSHTALGMERIIKIKK